MPAVRARARRIRTVHRTGYAAALAVAVVLALLVPFLVTRPAPRHNVPIQPAPSVPTLPVGPPPSVPALPSASSHGVIHLPGGWVVTGMTYSGAVDKVAARASVLDRRTQTYREVRYPVAWPAPTGTAVLVEYLDSTAYALVDLATDKVRQLRIPQGATHPEWSPDGRRIVFSRPLFGYGLVDVATATVVEHGVDMSQRYRCNDNCEFVWYRDSRQIALAQTDPTVEHDESLPDVQRGLQLFDAGTGTPGQLLPVHGIAHSVWDWSPDGRYVAVEGTTPVGSSRRAVAQVVEVATGRVVSALPTTSPWGTVGWVNNQWLLVVSGNRVCLASRAGALGECSPLPAFDGARQLLFGPG
jgi:hypothetical protein